MKEYIPKRTTTNGILVCETYVLLSCGEITSGRREEGKLRHGLMLLPGNARMENFVKRGLTDIRLKKYIKMSLTHIWSRLIFI